VRSRAPLDGHGGRLTSGPDLQVACQVVDRSGVVGVLTALVDSDVGRPRAIGVRAPARRLSAQRVGLSP
jgi:hypothetical protein